jgi:hypothetical protein
MSGSKNEINMASQAVIDDDVFNKLCFVNQIWTQNLIWVHLVDKTKLIENIVINNHRTPML